MKSYTTLLLACAFLISLQLSAQINSGTIDYLETFTFPVWEGASIDMKKRIAEARARGDFDRMGRLSFNQEAFSYEQLPLDDSGPKRGRGNGWMTRQSNNPDIYYTNLSDSIVTDQRRIMDRSFIMEDKWIVPEWEIPENQRPNMAYTLPSEVAYAVSVEGDTLTAYFSRSIPLSIGPKGYGGLPGAIVYLKVEKNDNVREYTMQTMQPHPSGLTFEKPKDGEVISREKFEKIREKRQKAMERRRRGWKRSRQK